MNDQTKEEVPTASKDSDMNRDSAADEISAYTLLAKMLSHGQRWRASGANGYHHRTNQKKRRKLAARMR